MDTSLGTGREPSADFAPAVATTDASPDANLAQLFRSRSVIHASRPRWRQRQGDGWRAATFAENQRLVNRLIAGLAALGAQPGDVIGILAGTRWEWLAADWAILGLGGVTTMIYASNLPATIGLILRDSGARYLFLENRAQYDKLAQVSGDLSQLRALILFEDADSAADDPRVVSFEALRHLSPLSDEQADALAAERAAAIAPDAVCSIVYTSGTTGEPKGVVHTHRTLLAQLAGARAMLPTVHAGMRDTLFLPLSHVFGRLEHLFTLERGVETVVVPSLDALAGELRASRPDIMLGVPRVYEKAYAAIRSQIASGSFVSRRIASWAESAGRAASLTRERGEPLPPLLRLRLAVADRLVLRRVRAALGGRLQFAITGSAPIDVEILRFFFACGVPLLEGWGLTETGGAFTVNTLDRTRLGTVGPAFPGHEIRIAEDGEVLVRGPCVVHEYWHNPAATAEAFDADGWFRTGDIGSLDEDGFLRIVDRKKELIVTAGGKKIAPQFVEHLLQTIPLVSQACVYGDRKPYLVALLTVDRDAAAAWARRHGMAEADASAVWHSPEFRVSLERQVARVNAQLASYEQVKYFDVLDEDFTIENGLATPTLKIRRRQIVARYCDSFEALYRPTRTHWDAAE
jgi:long-chain acyl-CoA synthetase